MMLVVLIIFCYYCYCIIIMSTTTIITTAAAAATTTTTSGLVLVQLVNQILFSISYCAPSCHIRTRSWEVRPVRFVLQSTPFLVMGLMMVVVLVAAVAVVANKSIIGLRAAYRLGASDALCLLWSRIVQHKCCPRAGTALPEHVLEAHTRT